MVKYYNSEQECVDNIKDNLLQVNKDGDYLYNNEPVKSFVDFEDNPALIKTIKAGFIKGNVYSYFINRSGDFLKKVEFDIPNIDTIELFIGDHLMINWDSVDSSTDFCFSGGTPLFASHKFPISYIVKYKKIADIAPDIKAHYVYYGNNDRKLLTNSVQVAKRDGSYYI